ASNAHVYRPAGSPWTFAGPAGLASNGSAFNNPTAPGGTQVAFLQRTTGSQISSISQAVNLAAGAYSLTLLAAHAPGKQQTVQVEEDGTIVATVAPQGSQFAFYGTNPFTVTAGSHTIQFSGLNPGGDNTAFVDQIQISIANSLVYDQRGPGNPRMVGAVDI